MHAARTSRPLIIAGAIIVVVALALSWGIWAMWSGGQPAAYFGGPISHPIAAFLGGPTLPFSYWGHRLSALPSVGWAYWPGSLVSLLDARWSQPFWPGMSVWHSYWPHSLSSLLNSYWPFSYWPV